MGIQDINAGDPQQDALDLVAREHAKIYLSAWKAATIVADEINRSETPTPHPETVPPRAEGDPEPDEEDLDAAVLGIEETAVMATEIYKQMVGSMASVAATYEPSPPPEPPPAQPAPHVPPGGRKLRVGGP